MNKLNKVQINTLSGCSILIHEGSEISLNSEIWKIEKTINGIFVTPKTQDVTNEATSDIAPCPKCGYLGWSKDGYDHDNNCPVYGCKNCGFTNTARSLRIG